MYDSSITDVLRAAAQRAAPGQQYVMDDAEPFQFEPGQQYAMALKKGIEPGPRGEGGAGGVSRNTTPYENFQRKMKDEGYTNPTGVAYSPGGHAPWTVERTQRVAERWRAGESATKIGEELGLSRSAVIARMRRMGIATPTAQGSHGTYDMTGPSGEGFARMIRSRRQAD